MEQQWYLTHRIAVKIKWIDASKVLRTVWTRNKCSKNVISNNSYTFPSLPWKHPFPGSWITLLFWQSKGEKGRERAAVNTGGPIAENLPVMWDPRAQLWGSALSNSDAPYRWGISQLSFEQWENFNKYEKLGVMYSMNANDYLIVVKNPIEDQLKWTFKGFQNVEQITQGQGNYHSETS